MTEAIVSGVISLVIFAVGYGRLHEKIATLEEHKKHSENKMEGINEINVTLEGMKRDIHYIKEKLDKE